MMRTRSIPNKKILQIAINMHCHFIVYPIDEELDVKYQKHSSIDTRKNSKVVADREVRLLLFKDHFMIDDNEKLPITTYYIEHRDELDEKHAEIPVEKRFRIRGVNQTGYPLYTADDWTGNDFTKILHKMFECNYFRKINQCEQDILATCEFDNHLNDYTEFNYDEELCCQAESSNVKN